MELRHWYWFPLVVAVNSVLGLARPMVDGEPSVFVDVWAASVAGDIVFVAGTAAVYWLAWTMLVHPRSAVRWAAVPAAFVADWCCYAFAWTFTGAAMFDEQTILEFVFVMQWGWVGLAASAIVPGVVAAIRQSRAETRGPAPAPR